MASAFSKNAASLMLLGRRGHLFLLEAERRGGGRDEKVPSEKEEV